MKFIYLVIIAIFFIWPRCNAQKLDCESEFEIIETKIKSQKTVSYKIAHSQKLYTEESFEFSEGTIIISDLNDKISTDEIIEIIVAIGVKNKLSKILAFKTCKAYEIYFQEDKLTSQQSRYLDENLLPSVEININKSLSKKEQKKHKQKRDLVELISKESCEKLKQLDTEKLSKEQINEVVTNTSVQYVKKIEKVYEMSFEESTIKFLEDLFGHLIIDCELIKEHLKEFSQNSN